MNKVSKKQQDIINYINDYKKEKNKMPYTTEIAHHFGKSNSAISGMLKRLKDKGLLEYDNHYNAKIYNSKKSTLDRLQQENQQLKDKNTQLRIEISAIEEDYRKLEKIVKDVGMWNTLYNEEFNKNKRLEGNWKKLKEYAKDNLYFYSGYQGEDLETDIAIQGVLDKITELERGVSDEIK